MHGYLAFFCLAALCCTPPASRCCAEGSHCSPSLLYQGQSGTHATIATATPPPYTYKPIQDTASAGSESRRCQSFRSTEADHAAV